MADNTTLNLGAGGDDIRNVQRGGVGPKTQAVIIDANPTGAESLVGPTNPLPVVIPVLTASGNITTQNLVPAGVATAGSAVEITLSGRSQVAVQTTGTFTGALSAQATVNGTTWVTLGGVPIVNAATGGGQPTIASASQGVFFISAIGFEKIRITGLAAMTGSAAVTLRAADNTNAQTLVGAIPTGANLIGNVIVNSVSAVTNAGPAAPSATVGGFLTFSTLVAGAGANATLVKASGGTIGLIYAHNNSASVKYVKVFNKATAPVPGTDTPIMNYAVPANGFCEINVAAGLRLATGIGIAITGGQALLDATAVVAGDVTLNLAFI